MSGPQHDFSGPQKRKTSEQYTLLPSFFNVKKTKTTSIEDVAPQNTQNISVSTTDDDDPACSSTGAISLEVLPVLQNVDDLPLVLPFIVGTDGHPRYLQKEWFVLFPWLKLCDDGKTCGCSVCYWAIVNKRIRQGQRGNSLLNSKWVKKEDAWQSFKQGKSHLRDHDAGIDHTNAWNVYQMELNKQHVEVKLGIRNKKEIEINNTGLRVTFDSILTCATQGIALRGHRDEKETDNLWNLVHLVSRFNSNSDSFFSSKEEKYKFMSPEIQNEIVGLMSSKLQQYFLTKIREESTAGKAKKEGRFFFSCIMDETQDIRRREQVSLCLRYVDSKLQPAEVFFGFYHAKKTDAGSLLDILKSALEELHLPFCNLRGQGYDGAASMSGKESGLQTRVRQENPQALWVYCFGHNLNLVVQDSIKKNPNSEMENALIKMQSVINFIKGSPKRYEIFKEMVEQAQHQNKHELRPLCPTRWVMKLASVDIFLQHYPTVLEQLEITQTIDSLHLKIVRMPEAIFVLWRNLTLTLACVSSKSFFPSPIQFIYSVREGQ